MPPGLQAVRILEGTARLHLEGREPDAYPTLLPPGVYFTNPGYDALTEATTRLQVNLKALEAKVKHYEAIAVTPPPVVGASPSGRWDTGDVVLAVVAGVLVGAGGVVVLQAARAP